MNVIREVAKVARGLKSRVRLIGARTKRNWSSARFIAVTGSSGKTSTVQLLSKMLAVDHQVAHQSFNNSEKSAINLLCRVKRSDAFTILEAGTGAPGQLERITNLFKPDISIVTLVAIEHYSAFRQLAAIAHEKASLVRALPANGLALLNFDDPSIRDMAAACAAPVRFFGCTGGDYRAFDLKLGQDGRLQFKIAHDRGTLPLNTRLIGEHNWLCVTAAASCALELGISPETVAQCVEDFDPIPGRMSLHTVANGPTFLLDTYKAPLHSVTLPFAALAQMNYSRKRIIVGSLSDYPGNPKRKYRDVYLAARAVADEIIFVGEHAHRIKALPEDLEAGRFYAFPAIRSAFDHLLRTHGANEVILIKTSQNLHLERLMLAFAHHVQCWADACGRNENCMTCGLFKQPFAEHGGKNRRRRRAAAKSN